MLLLTQTDNDRTAEVHIGDSVRINLPENATTGFRWAIDGYDEQLFELVATEPHYPKDFIGRHGRWDCLVPDPR
jgi:inhibitor of cysteine peptidase